MGDTEDFSYAAMIKLHVLLTSNVDYTQSNEWKALSDETRHALKSKAINYLQAEMYGANGTGADVGNEAFSQSLLNAVGIHLDANAPLQRGGSSRPHCAIVNTLSALHGVMNNPDIITEGPEWACLDDAVRQAPIHRLLVLKAAALQSAAAVLDLAEGRGQNTQLG